MTTHEMHCEDPWFTYISQGLKPVEGRKNTPAYQTIQAGDQINFTNGKENFLANVIEVRKYDSLEQYFKDVGLEKALPGTKSIEDGLNIYYQWSSKEKIKQYGFLGIFVKPI